MTFKNFTLLSLLCLQVIPVINAQIDSGHLMDSIEIERGVTGTNDFEPFFKIIHEAYDEENRPTRSVIYEYITPSTIVQNQRQQFQYDENGNMVFFLLESWDNNQQDWIPVKQENSSYTNGRLSMLLRQIEANGDLVNYRRWMYNYNVNGSESEKSLQEWNPDIEEWENLSRKMTTYTTDEKIETQMTQQYVDGNWQNRRLRTWTWNPGDLQPSLSLFQRWNNQEQEWGNDTRKIYGMAANGLWSGSVVERWNNQEQEWEPDIREIFTLDSGNGTFSNEGELWENNAWQPYLLSNYTFNSNQNPTLLKSWDSTNMEYENFLRHRLTYNDDRLPERRIGMQRWNTQNENWENRNYTRRVTFFWTEDESTATEEAQVKSDCSIPNPYHSGSLINCDIPVSNNLLLLEVINLLGQTVAKERITDQVFPIQTSLNEGLYLVRILDEKQVYHLEKVFITH